MFHVSRRSRRVVFILILLSSSHFFYPHLLSRRAVPHTSSLAKGDRFKDKMEEDPINNFFTAKEVEDAKILYSTLAITSTATSEEIRKAYRKLALRYHPDKHTTKDETEKGELGRTFQRVGFAYAVLSDEAKRKRYAFFPIEVPWDLGDGMV